MSRQEVATFLQPILRAEASSADAIECGTADDINIVQGGDVCNTHPLKGILSYLNVYIKC